MKKFWIFLLAAVLMLALAGCGEDYSKHNFDGYLGEDFHWDMTKDDAIQYVNDRDDIVKAVYNDYETFSSVTNRTYTFRFDEDGRLELVKINLHGNENKFRLLKEQFGEPDEYEESYDSYLWYGTMEGKNTVMTYSKYPAYDLWLEFEPAD